MPEFTDDTRTEDRPAARRAGYAEWIALGAVAAGSVGAIVGMAKCRSTSRHRMAGYEETDASSVTAPHGDKLRGAVVQGPEPRFL